MDNAFVARPVLYTENMFGSSLGLLGKSDLAGKRHFGGADRQVANLERGEFLAIETKVVRRLIR